ncbi:MAG: DUF4834 family protein [Chitinophagaceae bacterium]|nr:DUF4834 family protein [Chitinophagaceae bacterium]
MRYIFYILIGYLLYRFLTNFVFPVYKTGKQIKKQFDEMQQQMQDNMRQSNAGAPPPQQKPSKDKTVGEYIDFEEIT